MMYDLQTQAEVLWTPVAHTSEHLKWLDKLGAALPLIEDHWTLDENSYVHKMSISEYNKCSSDAKNSLFAQRHIVLWEDDEAQIEAYNFDAHLIEEIGGGDPLQTFTIYDLSSYSEREFQLPLSVLTENAAAADKTGSGRILNAISIPNLNLPGHNGENVLASSWYAWRTSSGLPFLPRTEQYPFSTLEWCLASTAGAWTDFHIDSNGLATRVRVISGAKLWIIAEPRPHASFKKCDFQCYIECWDGSSLNLADFILIPILLHPGITLIMKPLTLHAVVTTSHCVALGDQFYHNDTLHDSIYGYYHTFISSKTLTNVDHSQAAHQQFHRMLGLVYSRYILCSEYQGAASAYPPSLICHTLDLSSSESILDTVHLCVLLELGGAVYQPTYEFQPMTTLEDKIVSFFEHIYYPQMCHIIACLSVGLQERQTTSATLHTLNPSLKQFTRNVGLIIDNIEQYEAGQRQYDMWISQHLTSVNTGYVLKPLDDYKFYLKASEDWK
ncbi:hypothetical protein AN958_01230 [Leucoagaricus sp. SymC.cos]|nr:hypothetical protein AN958_01230 [Leucoagaricus sp. SymC.cos]